MTPLDLLVGVVAALTIVAFGTLWVVAPAAALYYWGRPGGLEDVPRWKLAVAFPMLGFALLFAALEAAKNRGEPA